MLSTGSFAANPAVYNPRLFSFVNNLPDAKRVDSARAVYKVNCRRLTSAEAMRSLNDLDHIAIGLSDLPLQCAVLDMRADYYSVNQKLNAKSTKYHDDAIAFAEAHNMPLESAIYMHRKAIYYFTYKQNIPACRYFLFSQEKFKEVGYDHVPGMANYFSEVATFYYSIGDYDNARQKLTNALRYQLKPSRTRISILNTMGLTYRNTGKYQHANRYFNQALQMAQATRDSAFAGIATGNIGSVYFLQHQYAIALPLVRTDYAVSLKYHQVLNAAIAMLRLVQMTMDTGELEMASSQLDTVNNLLMRSSEDTLRYRANYYRLKSQLAKKMGQTAKALNYHTQFVTMQDSVELRDNLAAVEGVRLQWELDKSKSQLARVKAKDEAGRFKRNSVIILLLLLIVITLLVYNRQRLKANKDKQLLASEKLRLDEELKNAELALHGYTENLMQKNLLIEEFKSELDKLKLKFDTEDGARELDNMLKVHIMTDENWVGFKKLFTKVHPAFFYNLRNRFPGLTGTDVRLLALLKLNLNNREMAGMLGITTDGVKKAKQRLRKKTQLQAGEEIEDIVKHL